VKERDRSGTGRPIPSEELLWDWLREGWRYRLAHGWTPQPGSVDQIRLEMGLIVGQDFVDYFLVVSYIVRYAKDHGIAVGPGRGSSAASLVCFLLRITEVDPLLYPLMDFSRFIVPGREDPPDIDIDFDDGRRNEVQAHAAEKFNQDRVGNVGTFTKFKGRNTIDDVARVYRIPKSDAEALKDMIIDRSGGDSRADATLEDTLAMFPQAAEILEKHPALKMAVALEGNYRGMSTHSAGLIITNTPIAEVCAQYEREDAKGRRTVAVSVNKYDAEYLGLMKIDLLGLKTMGMLASAIAEVGMSLEDLYAIPTGDPETLAAFQRCDVVGIFQFEGRATRLVTRDVKPDSFLECVDINGLSRPGPLFSGTTAEYIDVKYGKREMVSLHPIIDEITKGTKGTIIYQEQILRALSTFGGLPLRRVHDIRRIISQKLGEAQFNTSAEDFMNRSADLHGVSRKLAMEVWSRVVTSASYAFVYAHSLSYTLIGFWAQYMKVHYPEAFYAAQLAKLPKEKWARLIKDAEKHGIKVRGVVLGASGSSWTIRSGEVLAGYTQLNGVGEVLGRKLDRYAAEKGKALVSVDQLLEVNGVGPAVLEKFREQLESDDPFGLLRVRRGLAAVAADIASGSIPLPRPTHNSDGILDAPADARIYWMGYVKLKEYKDFIEDERARSGKDVATIRKEMRRPDLPTSCVLHCYDADDEDVYVRVNRFDYPRLQRALSKIRPGHDVIYVRARKSKGGFGASMYAEEIVVIDPEEE
jgi:DNA polymerase-3 subunit alpha